MKHISLLLFSLGITTFLIAQDELQIARKAKTIFPKEKVVSLKSFETIEFTANRKKGGKPIAIQTIQEEFTSLESQEKFHYAVFYDDYSKVESFKGKPTPYVLDTYYQSDDIFHSDVRVKYASFNLGQFGSQGNFTAEKTFQDLKYMTRVYFPGIYSTLDRRLQFVIPDEFDVELLEMNFEGYNIQKTVSQSKGKTHYAYSMEKVDKFSKKSGLPGGSHIYPHILVCAKGFNNGEKTEKFFSNTDELYKWYRTLINGIQNKPEELKSQVEELIKDCETDAEKVEKIFYWVQNNIRYIAFEDGLAGYQPENCQTVLHNRYGDCKGMANLTKEMLNLVGFDARLAWLGTRTIAYDYSVASLATDNHMICALKQEDGFLFLDATEKFMNVGDYAERIQGQNVLIEDGDSYILEHIPSKDFSQNIKKIDLNLTLNEKNELIGDVQFELKGEVRSEILYYVNHTPGKKQEELYKIILKAGDALSSVQELKITGDSEEDKNLIINGLLTIPNKVSSFDGEYYLYLNPYQYLSSYEFSDDRKFDYWFDYKENDEINIQFEVPTGFQLESIPDNFKAQDEEYLFDINYEKEANSINYKMRIQIPKATISHSKMETWNKMIKELNEHYNQPIILMKKS